MNTENNDMQLNSDKSGAHENRRHFFTKKKIIAFSVVAALILFNVFDIFIDPPAWWRFERQEDKRAILKYVKDNYPDTIKILDKSFPLQMPAGGHQFSHIQFELDGVTFNVIAAYGEVISDSYYYRKADTQFDKIIKDGFLKPRNITASLDYSYWDNYKTAAPYTGNLGLEITILEQGATAREVGWIYDFYEFWENEGAFLKDYRVCIRIIQDKEERERIVWNKQTLISDEDEFYSAIKRNDGFLIS